MSTSGHYASQRAIGGVAPRFFLPLVDPQGALAHAWTQGALLASATWLSMAWKVVLTVRTIATAPMMTDERRGEPICVGGVWLPLRRWLW